MAESWSRNNAPVGARLFGGPGPSRPGTAPSAARLNEIDRIARLYGVGPYGPQPSTTPLAPVPSASLEELYGLIPPEIGALPAMPAPPEPMTRPAPAAVAADADPSSASRAPAVAPQESGRRLPHGAASALAWRDFLGDMAGSLWSMRGGLPQLGPPGAAQIAATVRENGVAEPGQYMAPDNYPQFPAPDTPMPTPPTPPTEATTTADAMAGVTRGRPYARLALQDPDYAAVMREYDQSAPRNYQEDPNDRTMRLVAAALAGGFGGSPNDPLAPLGAIGSLSAGYAREGDRARAIADREDERRVGYQRGRAALMGDQENSRWQTGFQRQTFDRGSQQMEENNAIAREELGIRRESAGLSRTLTQMRINALARQAGMEVGPADMLSRALPDIVRNSAPLIVQTERGMQQLMLPIAPEFLRGRRGEATPTGVTMMSPADARRRVSETLLPQYAASPQALDRAVNGVLSQAYMHAILGTPEPQRQQLMQQAFRWYEDRPRAGAATLEN